MAPDIMINVKTAICHFKPEDNEVLFKVDLLKDINTLVFYTMPKTWSGTKEDLPNRVDYPSVDLNSGEYDFLNEDEAIFTDHDVEIIDLRDVLTESQLKESLIMLQKVEKLNTEFDNL